MRRTICSAVAIAALSSGCSTVKCGDGTFRSGDDCAGYDPSDKTPPVTMLSPTVARSRAPLPGFVTLTTNEPARIYFSIDGSTPDPTADPGQRDTATVTGFTQGSTLKYFSIDQAGNQEAVQSVTFDSDATPPAPVTGMTVVVTGTTAHVSWTNPTDADFAGTVLARVGDVIDAAPTQGQLVPSGTDLSPSLRTVSVGTDVAFDDPARPPGPVRYVAWTRDDLGNYSTPVAATAAVPVGNLTATLTFGTTLAIATSPDNLDLTGTQASLSGTTLTVALRVKNNTTQYFQNPKVEVASVTSAAFASPDGTADGHPFRSLGPTMLAPGATASASLVFTGLASGTTATINLAFAQHDSMASTYGQAPMLSMIDLGSGQILSPLTMTELGPNDRKGGRARPGSLIGGHFLDVPTTHGVVERFDLATGLRVGEATIGNGGRTNVQSLTPTGAGEIAVVKLGGRRRTSTIELVRLDEGLHVLARLPLPSSDGQGFARPALSPDGRVLAVPVGGGILLVDAGSMTPIDLDPSTPDPDPIVTPIGGSPRSVVFFNSTDMLVLAKTNGQAAILRSTPGGYETELYQDGAAMAKGYSAAVASDGKVWLAFDAGLRVYDPATDAVSSMAYGATPMGLSVVDGQVWVIRDTRRTLDQLSNTGQVQRTLSLPTGPDVSVNGIYGHWLTALH